MFPEDPSDKLDLSFQAKHRDSYNTVNASTGHLELFWCRDLGQNMCAHISKNRQMITQLSTSGDGAAANWWIHKTGNRPKQPTAIDKVPHPPSVEVDREAATAVLTKASVADSVVFLPVDYYRPLQPTQQTADANGGGKAGPQLHTTKNICI